MTLQEIKEAVSKSKELQKELALFASQTDEGKTLLNNFAQAEKEKAVKEATANIYTGLDNDLFEVLGQRKKANQKTYDFIKSLANDFKELKAKETSLNESTKVKDLEAKIKELQDSGSVNEHWRKIYEEARPKWEAEQKALKEELKAKEEGYFKAQVEAELAAGLSSLPIRQDLPKKALEALLEAEKAKLLKTAKLVEGKVVYMDEKGNPILNKEHSPIKSSELWEKVLGDSILAKDGQSGGGAKPTVKEGQVLREGQGDSATIKLVLDKSSFSTKVEFNRIAEAALRKQGVAIGSKEFNSALDGAYKEYEVDKLDLQ